MLADQVKKRERMKRQLLNMRAALQAERLQAPTQALALLEAQQAQPVAAVAGARALHTAAGPRRAGQAAAHLPLARGLAVARRAVLRR